MKQLFLLLMMSICLLSCYDKNVPQPSGNSSSNGPGRGSNPTPSPVLSLGGTKWKLTQYRDAGMTNPLPRTDTLVFTDATHLTWSHVPCTYYLSDNGIALHLGFYGSLFGDIDGSPATDFRSYGQISDVPFSQLIAGGGLTYYLWFQKLP